MKLKDIMSGQLQAAQWEQKGYVLPKFDINKVREKTYQEPTWVHFGGGNIFRAFPAAMLNDALNTGQYDRGVIVAETFDFEVIDKAYKPYDNLSLLVSLKGDGTVEKKVIASVTEALKADYQFADWQRLVEIFQKPSLQMISFTITEKGYGYNEQDLQRGLQPVFALGKVTALLYERYKAGRLPITVQSMDNCSHNGDRVKAGVLAYAERWVNDGLVPEGFADYVRNKALVTFPWSMIDKITPRPHEKVKELLAKDGFEDNEYIETEKHTFTAPFVNAEETQYLVIEDDYTNGRPPLHLGGALYTTRETVDKVETMKVTTCLNPLHTAMSIYGCMLGYTLISAEMQDEDLRSFIQKIGYIEAMPVVTDPGVLNPYEFIGACAEPLRVHRCRHQQATAQSLHARCPAAHRHGYEPETAHPLRRDHQEVHPARTGQGKPRAHPPGAGRLCPLPEGTEGRPDALRAVARPDAAGAAADCCSVGGGQAGTRL